MKRLMLLILMLATYSCTSGNYAKPKLIIESVKDSGLYGIIDEKEKILIKPQYSSIRALENDTFLVSDSLNGDIYLDNTGVMKKIKGNYFEPSFVTIKGLREDEPENRWVYDYFGNSLFQLPDGLYLYHLYRDGFYIVTEPDKELYGFIDNNGRLIIECLYDQAYQFDSGYGLVEKEKLYFYINKNGINIFKKEWKKASPFSENRAGVFNGEKWGFIDTKGELVIDYQYDAITQFSNGLSRVLIGDDYPDPHFYFIDQNGKIVIDCHKNGWIDVQLFNAGLAAVQRKDQRWIFIDKTGKQAFPGDFAYAFRFEQSLCIQEQFYLDSTDEGRQELSRRPAFALVVMNKTWDTDDLGSLAYEEKFNIESRPVYIDTSGKIISDYFRD